MGDRLGATLCTKAGGEGTRMARAGRDEVGGPQKKVGVVLKALDNDDCNRLLQGS